MGGASRAESSGIIRNHARGVNMKLLENMKENKETIMMSFWAGIGFWTASKVVREFYVVIKDYLIEGF